MIEPKIKLTPKQNAVIYCLQNGWVLITSSSMKGAIVGCHTHEYHINNGLFWRLFNMGLIWQSTRQQDHYNYILTQKGKTITTRKVEIPNK